MFPPSQTLCAAQKKQKCNNHYSLSYMYVILTVIVITVLFFIMIDDIKCLGCVCAFGVQEVVTHLSVDAKTNRRGMCSRHHRPCMRRRICSHCVN